MRIAVVLAAGVVAVVARVWDERPGDVVGRFAPARRRQLVEPFEDVLVQPGQLKFSMEPVRTSNTGAGTTTNNNNTAANRGFTCSVAKGMPRNDP